MLFPFSFVDVSVGVTDSSDPREAIISPLSLIVTAILHKEFSFLRDVVTPESIESHSRCCIVAPTYPVLHVVTEISLVVVAFSIYQNAFSFNLIVDPVAFVITALATPVLHDSLAVLEAVFEVALINIPSC